jgi:cell volume regulation protein A
MTGIGSYGLIMVFSGLIILSFFYNIVSKKTNIPSVLLLITTGIVFKPILKLMGYGDFDFMPVLEIFGIVGLIMIVLEAALELEITKKKLPLLFKSFGVAFISMVLTSIAISYIFIYFFEVGFENALLYAIPIATMSSAIVLPSVENLEHHKKEFMIYESTFSDILGILFFYFLLEKDANATAQDIIFSISGNVFISIILAISLSLALIFVFQKIQTKVKLFLLIAVLMLLYSVGKKFHLSALLIILIFGLILQNHRLLFKGKLGKRFSEGPIKMMLSNLQTITFETSFVVRTFFFIVFGITITLTSVFDLNVLLISLLILIALFGVRLISLLIFQGKKLFPMILISPRGLITILLFYEILLHQEFVIDEFNEAVLLVIILITSAVMAYALINESKVMKKKKEIENYEEPSEQQILETETNNAENSISEETDKE